MTTTLNSHPIINTLECHFKEDKVGTIIGYTCILNEVFINVITRNQSITIIGIHKNDRNNYDVKNIKILDSYTRFISSKLLEVFPKVEGLDIRKSSLHRIQPFALSLAPYLKEIIVVDNKIPKLENGSFQGLVDLKLLLLINNKIESIESAAFYGLHKLKVLWITHNHFTALDPTTFSSLVHLKQLIIRHNFLTRIDGELFSCNSQLQQLILNDNKICQIDPTFIDNLDDLEVVKLKNNFCIDKDFVEVDEKIYKRDLRALLDECIENFMVEV